MAPLTLQPVKRLADLLGLPREQDGPTNLPANAVQLFGGSAAGSFGVLPLTQFFDTQNVQIQGRIKSIYIYPWSGGVPTKGAASQATVSIYSGLEFFNGGSGAGSALPHAGAFTDQSVVGTAVNLGASAATLPVSGSPYIFTPTDIPQLQWELPWVGIEINWGGAIISGAAAIFLIVGPNS